MYYRERIKLTLKKTPSIAALLLVLGCSANGVLCVRYEFDTTFNSDLVLSAFILPDTIAAATTKYYEYYDPITRGQIAKKEAYRTGADYLITFDETDFERLRLSLIQSLHKSQGFKQVLAAIPQTNTLEELSGLTLQIDFKSAGIRLEKIRRNLWGYVCYLDSHIIMTKGGETVWEDDMYVEESSPSANKVKKKVIRAFLEEFGDRLAAI